MGMDVMGDELMLEIGVRLPTELMLQAKNLI
jgi:hypothetical protein